MQVFCWKSSRSATCGYELVGCGMIGRILMPTVISGRRLWAAPDRSQAATRPRLARTVAFCAGLTPRVLFKLAAAYPVRMELLWPWTARWRPGFIEWAIRSEEGNGLQHRGSPEAKLAACIPPTNLSVYSYQNFRFIYMVMPARSG